MANGITVADAEDVTLDGGHDEGARCTPPSVQPSITPVQATVPTEDGPAVNDNEPHRAAAHSDDQGTANEVEERRLDTTGGTDSDGARSVVSDHQDDEIGCADDEDEERFVSPTPADPDQSPASVDEEANSRVESQDMSEGSNAEGPADETGAAVMDGATLEHADVDMPERVNGDDDVNNINRTAAMDESEAHDTTPAHPSTVDTDDHTSNDDTDAPPNIDATDDTTERPSDGDVASTNHDDAHTDSEEHRVSDSVTVSPETEGTDNTAATEVSGETTAPTGKDAVSERIERLKQEYLQQALHDWQEDHPDEDPKTSDAWAREMEAALTDFYETLDSDNDDHDDHVDGTDTTPGANDEGSSVPTPVVEATGNTTDTTAETPVVASMAPPSDAPEQELDNLFAGISSAQPSPDKAPSAEPRAAATTEHDEAGKLTGWFRKSRGSTGNKPGDKNKRFFVLDGTTIRYYTKEPKPGKADKARGTIHVVPETQVAGPPGTLVLHNPDRTWKLQTEDQNLIESWIAAILTVVATLTKGDLGQDTTSRSDTAMNTTSQVTSTPAAPNERGGKPAPPRQSHKPPQNLASVFTATPTTTAVGTASNGKPKQFKGHVHGEIRQGMGIGGFTKTTLTPTPAAVAALKAAKGGKNNLVILKIVTEGMLLDVCSVDSCQVTVEDLRQRIVPKEPRYYVAVDGKVRVFIYCCPDDSPRKPRMLYSTGKSSAIETVTTLTGASPSSTCEISEADDLEEDNLRPTTATVRRRREAAKAAPPTVAAATRKPVMANPTELHGSLSAFMARELGDKAKPSVKKKIVILPDSARS